MTTASQHPTLAGTPSTNSPAHTLTPTHTANTTAMTITPATLAIAATAVTTVQGSPKYQLDVQAQNDDGDCATIDGPCDDDGHPCPDGRPKMSSPDRFEVELGPCLHMDCGASLEDVYIELQDASDHAVLARGHTDANGKVTLEYFKEGQCTPALDLGMRDTTGKFFVVMGKMVNFGSAKIADEPARTHSMKDGRCGHYQEEPCNGPAVAPFEPKD